MSTRVVAKNLTIIVRDGKEEEFIDRLDELCSEYAKNNWFSFHYNVDEADI